MLKDGKWADHVVLVAIAQILNRNILLMTCSHEAISGKANQWVVGDLELVKTTTFTYFQGTDGVIDFTSYIQSDWNTYLKSMSRDGEWADHVVLVAMAHMLKRDIMVVTSSPEETGDKAVQWIVGDVNFKGTPIRLGHVWELHYMSLGMKKITNTT